MAVPSLRVDGHVALVTGASSGLGLSFAEVLAEAGAKVILAARRVDKLTDEVARLRELGYSVNAVAMDVTDRESVQAAFQHIEQLVDKPVDILVNNAGLSGRNYFLDMEEAEWDQVVDTSLKGAYLVAQVMAKRLVAHKQGGSIINIASILAERVSATVAPYCAAKAGLVHLTKALALELARYGIRVNALAPGYIATDLNRDFWQTEAGKSMIKRIPQRRLGELKDLAAPLLLLASSASAYMTGSVITIDGGHVCSSV